jgi:hypothetical protein
MNSRKLLSQLLMTVDRVVLQVSLTVIVRVRAP